MFSPLFICPRKHCSKTNQDPPPSKWELLRTPFATGLTSRSSLDSFHCRIGLKADYRARVKEMVKALDLVQFGGPEFTVLRTFRWEVLM